MPEVLERGDHAVGPARLAAPVHGGASVAPPLLPDVRVAEGAAKRSLHRQIARLEEELASLFCATYPRTGFQWDVTSRGGPRLLSVRELERVRDELDERLRANRLELSERTYVEECKRRHIEEMLLDPAAHRWEIVSNADIGERGCKHWHVRPQWGVLGMLMNWWRVKISSGCPLAGGRGRWP